VAWISFSFVSASHCRELEKLAVDAVSEVHKAATGTKLLINSRIDVAIAAAPMVFISDPIALRSSPPAKPQHLPQSGVTKPTSRFCHTLEDVYSAEAHGADFAVFGPVLAKSSPHRKPLPRKTFPGRPGATAAACHREAAASSRMPSWPGGITLANAQACLESGAAGIAAIRVFQPDNIASSLHSHCSESASACSEQRIRRRHPYQG